MTLKEISTRTQIGPQHQSQLPVVHMLRPVSAKRKFTVSDSVDPCIVPSRSKAKSVASQASGEHTLICICSLHMSNQPPPGQELLETHSVNILKMRQGNEERTEDHQIELVLSRLVG